MKITLCYCKLCNIPRVTRNKGGPNIKALVFRPRSIWIAHAVDSLTIHINIFFITLGWSILKDLYLSPLAHLSTLLYTDGDMGDAHMLKSPWSSEILSFNRS